MSQQINTYLTMAFAEIEGLKKANEALAARVTALELTPEQAALTQDTEAWAQANGLTAKRGPGRPRKDVSDGPIGI